LSILVNATGAESSDTANVERVVGADALGLKTVFFTVTITAEISVACPGELNNGITDGVAFSWDVVPVETDVCAGEVEKGSESESDG
jgi:hypothetical protein